MPSRAPNTFFSAAAKRQSLGAQRTLVARSGEVDLCSNDYLGIARNLGEPGLLRALLAGNAAPLGATGSRLITGHSAEHDELENFLAGFHRAEAALLFGSGYEANLGLLSSIATRNDTILYDELAHASIRDGVRLSHARSYSFRHNDCSDLRRLLKIARGNVFIVVESLYSMDGDTSPLEAVCCLAEEQGAFVIVDEAHATGIYGPTGQGLVVALSLESRVLARVHTFGKALGYRGACVVGPTSLREHLINTSRPFVYSTATDRFSLALTRQAYQLMVEATHARAQLRSLVSRWNEIALQFSSTVRGAPVRFLPSQSPIQGIFIPGNAAVVAAERRLMQHGYFVRAIRSPTVPEGHERLRVCLHSFNTPEELQTALSLICGSADIWEAA
jgi:8-amino-7-oxononanoate synthase